jgi:hypothetical protein
MGLVTYIRALLVRILFACHGVMAIWRLYMVTGSVWCWYLGGALFLLFLETLITIAKKRGKEWKWWVSIHDLMHSLYFDRYCNHLQHKNKTKQYTTNFHLITFCLVPSSTNRRLVCWNISFNYSLFIYSYGVLKKIK